MKPKPLTKQELRKFGLVMAGAFGLIGALLWWKDVGAAPYLGGLATFFLVSGLLVPTLLRPVEKGWMKLALVISAIMTRVILTLTFYLFITPFGLVLRLVGKDLLHLKKQPGDASYWRPVEPDGPGSRIDRPY